MKTLFRVLLVLLSVLLLAVLLISYGDELSGRWFDLVGSEKPIKAKSIVIGYPQEPSILNPYLPDGTSAATKMVTSNILWGFLVVTPDLKYAPRIAESVPTLENGLVTKKPFTVTFKIKEDAVWSDGEPITAEDVGFTWDVIMNPRYQIADRSGYDKIERIDTPDEKTVKIVFKEPYAYYKNLFSVTHPILPGHILKDFDINDAINNIIPFASGPYRFKEWKRGSYLTIVRNEQFWGERPRIEKVTFKFTPNINDLLSSFVKNKVDVVYIPSGFRIADYKGTLGYLKGLRSGKLEIDRGMVWEHMAFNLSRFPLDDANVRKAIAHSIDRKKIASEVLGEEQVLESVLVPSQKPYFTPAWDKYVLDTGKAATHLAISGYRKGSSGYLEKGGNPLEIDVSTMSGDMAREKTAVAIRDCLESLGVKSKIRNTDKKTFLESWAPEGNFDVATWAWVSSHEPRLDHLFAADRIPPAGQNYYRYTDDFANRIFENLSSEINRDERSRLYRKIQEKISDDAVVIPLYSYPEILAYDRRLKGLGNNISFEGPFWNIDKWRISGK